MAEYYDDEEDRLAAEREVFRRILADDYPNDHLEDDDENRSD